MDWASSTLAEVDATTPVAMQCRMGSGEKGSCVVKKVISLSISCLSRIMPAPVDQEWVGVCWSEERKVAEVSFSTCGWRQKPAELLCLTPSLSMG